MEAETVATKIVDKVVSRFGVPAIKVLRWYFITERFFDHDRKTSTCTVIEKTVYIMKQIRHTLIFILSA